MDKGEHTIVSTFRWLEDLLWGGVHFFTLHRNLACIFDPEACAASSSKTVAQGREHWEAVLGYYNDSIRYISGQRSCWGDSLSRRVNVPAVSVREPDDTLLSEDDIPAAQEQACAGFRATVAEAISFTAAIGCFEGW